MKAYLILENGKIFEGFSFGVTGEVTGEIVFTTGMNGYLETLTDKSYYGQIITQTFPLIGNYGVIPEDFESTIISARGYIVKHLCNEPSNFRSIGDLDNLLKLHKVVGLYGIDTRELTKILREKGTMNGLITTALQNADFDRIKSYSIMDAVSNVSVKKAFTVNAEGIYNIAVFDFGYKENIIRELIKRNCRVTILPHNTDFNYLKSLNVSGVLLSNGPGNPADNHEIIHNIKKITESGVPVFGICLGHQLLALAHGFRTCKLKYGHRGVNQPVKDLNTGRCYITSQNHGYCVVNDSIDSSLGDNWFINVNDSTCEGLKYKNSKSFSVQFHPEGCSGPNDTNFLFDVFLEEVKSYAAR